MYMKKWIMICACVAVFQTALAQRITRQYNNVSFSAALKDLNARQHKYTINFVYDELEDFRVTKSIRNQSVPDAIMQLIGFYPIRMTQVEDNIMVECTQKTPTKMIGRIIDNKKRPVDFANVALLNVSDSSLINGGVTNENGQFVIPCEATKAINRDDNIEGGNDEPAEGGCESRKRTCRQEEGKCQDLLFQSPCQ